MTVSDSTAPVAAPAAAPPAAGRFYVEAGYAFAAASAVLFSTKGIAVKLAYDEPIDATLLLALRMALALPVYLAIGWIAVADLHRRGASLPRAARILQAAAVGALGYWVSSFLDFSGLEHLSAQFERLILYTYPLFVVIFGALFFRAPFTPRALAAFAVAYVGLAIIFLEKIEQPGSDIWLGSTFVFGSAITFALYQLLAKGLITEMGPRLFTCIAMLGATVGVLGQFLATRPIAEIAATSPRVWELALYLAIGATVLPSFFLSAALHRISAQANSTIATLSPVMTVILAVLILRETITPVDVAGAALVVGGIAWFTLSDRWRSPPVR